MMPRDQPVRQTVTYVIGQSIQPLARSAGFTKRGFNFHRRHGELIQAVNVQLAPFNIGPTGGFYINLGIAFDKLRALDGLAIDERLRPWQCHFYRRIADFCPDAPDLWHIDPGMDLQRTIGSLTNDFKVVLREFDAVTSIPSFLSRNVLQPGADYGLLAQLQYVSGNLTAASQALQLYAEFFADRQGCSIPQLIDRFHLSQLTSM